MRKLKPSTPSVTIIPAMPTSNSGRRPARSTKNIAMIVMPTFTTPTPTVARIAPEAELNPAA